MRILFGRAAWGWKMFGLLGAKSKWFIGFSIKETAPTMPIDLLVGDVKRGRK